MSELQSAEENRIGSSPSDRWRQRTLNAFLFSRVVTVLAVVLAIGGLVVYFGNFNFASGGDVRGMMIVLVGVFLAAIAMLGNLYSIYAAWRIRRYTGSISWLLIAILFPVVETAVFVVVWNRL